MSEMHSSPDRVVWFDLPVANLARASKFYGPSGNGGCLVPNAMDVSATGILVYMNVDGRIRDALRQAEKHGGHVMKAIESIGPHGFRAIVLDSEGNRIALHSATDK